MQAIEQAHSGKPGHLMIGDKEITWLRQEMCPGGDSIIGTIDPEMVVI
jgi:hypothetical protein